LINLDSEKSCFTPTLYFNCGENGRNLRVRQSCRPMSADKQARDERTGEHGR